MSNFDHFEIELILVIAYSLGVNAKKISKLTKSLKNEGDKSSKSEVFCYKQQILRQFNSKMKLIIICGEIVEICRL